MKHRIHPHIGEAFRMPGPADLRVAVVGLNAYYSERDWPPDLAKAPDDWARRFATTKGRFFTSARAMAED